MIDFKKRLVTTASQKQIDPAALYETLDRASDKGPLRPIQETILNIWHSERRNDRDVVVKLHTGQGKTLIGLLMLQSKMNEKAGPAIYLCPNNYLIEQTCTQATQFGIKFCVTNDGELPDEFLEGRCILITSVQKMFNGRTKFRLGARSLPVSYVVLDDAHACVDSIRDAFIIRLEKGTVAYQKLIALFSESLSKQGAGTFAEIRQGDYEALLPVPYWDWQERQTEVLEVLAEAVHVEDAKRDNKDGIWFVWPLVKDMLKDCRCLCSGRAIEISPYLPQLELFGSFWKADCRVYMSATVSNDAFLIRGLRLSLEALTRPLMYQKEKWSGEKMVLIPSLIHDEMDRSQVVNALGRKAEKRGFGVVVLCPSRKRTLDWAGCGASIATKDNLGKEIERLRKGECEAPLVIVNRYDGIDLPDRTCRVLILDSKPYSENLEDLYEEDCRETSDITSMRMARVIEQGLGRSVRGEKDYCAIVIIGAELVRFVRNAKTREHLSSQTRCQIEIGLEIAGYATEEMASGVAPLQVLINLINQCLHRDEGWKDFYAEHMNAISGSEINLKAFNVFKRELDAELLFRGGDVEKAVETIQHLIDDVVDPCDRYWYLQEMARMAYSLSKADSDRYQMSAYRGNMHLMQPRNGVAYKQLLVVSQRRMESIISWIRAKKTYEQLRLDVDEMLSCLEFMVKAEKFEKAFKELGVALGYNSERPDKEWKAGPDNLWCVEVGKYLLVECKNEVEATRAEICKQESGQMNNSCAWFKNKYPGCSVTNILIIPPKKLGAGAGFTENVLIMQNKNLGKLRKNVKAFFSEFAALDLNALTEHKVQELINAHSLATNDILTLYATLPI